MSKIIEGLKDVLAFSRCAHEFVYQRDHAFGGGIVGWCPKCRCRLTAWPGTIHYDEIDAARERQQPETGG